MVENTGIDPVTGRSLPFKVHASRLKLCPPEHVTSCPPLADAVGGATSPGTLIQPDSAAAPSSVPPPTDANGWHPIRGIRSRRRRLTSGRLEYLVEWLDDTTSWLPARDIDPALVRLYNASRRRRRH